MDSIASGLYFNLVNRNQSWPDRLKLAKFACTSSNITAASKEQAVATWLCNILVTKKKVAAKHGLPPDLKPAAWEILHIILKSHANHMTLKNSIVQSLLEALKNPLSSNLQYVLNSCLIIMSMPNLKRLFVSQIENMFDLLECLLKVAIDQMLNERLHAYDCLKLLDVILKECFVFLKQMACQKRVLNKLLAPAAVLLYECCHHITDNTKSTYDSVCSRIKNLISFHLFTDENMAFYRKWLSDIFNKDEETLQVSKFIQLLFNLFQEKYTTLISPSLDIEVTQNALLSFIAFFFEQFLINHKNSATTDNDDLKLFIVLCHFVGFDHDLPDLHCKFNLVISQDVSELSSFSALEKFLFAALSHDAFSHDNLLPVELKYFQEFVNKLLCWKRPLSPLWFNCMKSFYLLNYNIVHRRIVEVWLKCWFSVKEISSDIQIAQEEFLCCQLNIYKKLRQIDKYYKKLLLAIRRNLDPFKPFSERFAKELWELTMSLSSGIALEVWQDFISEFTPENIETYHEVTSLSNLVIVLYLFSEFLRHVQIFGKGISLSAKKIMFSLMHHTIEDVIKPLMDRCSKESWSTSLAVGTLQLCHTWALLSLSFKQFDNSNDLQNNLSLISNAWDISDVIICCSTSACKKLFKKTGNCENDSISFQIKYIWLQMYVLKIRYLLLFYNTERSNSIIKDLVALIYCNLPRIEEDGHWTGWVYNLDQISYSVAMWKLQLDHLMYLISYMNEEQKIQIASYLIHTLMLDSTQIHLPSWSTKQLSREFCLNPIYQAMKDFQSILFTQLWLFAKSLNRSKVKKSKSYKGYLFCAVLDSVTNSNISWNDADIHENSVENDSAWKCLHEVVTILNESWENFSKIEINIDQTAVLKFLEILDCFGMIVLTSLNQARNLLGLLLLLMVNQEIETYSLQLITIINTKILQILENNINLSLFDILHGSKLLLWMIQFHCQIEDKIYLNATLEERKLYEEIRERIFFMWIEVITQKRKRFIKLKKFINDLSKVDFQFITATERKVYLLCLISFTKCVQNNWLHLKQKDFCRNSLMVVYKIVVFNLTKHNYETETLALLLNAFGNLLMLCKQLPVKDKNLAKCTKYLKINSSELDISLASLNVISSLCHMHAIKPLVDEKFFTKKWKLIISLCEQLLQKYNEKPFNEVTFQEKQLKHKQNLCSVAKSTVAVMIQTSDKVLKVILCSLTNVLGNSHPDFQQEIVIMCLTLLEEIFQSCKNLNQKVLLRTIVQKLLLDLLVLISKLSPSSNLEIWKAILRLQIIILRRMNTLKRKIIRVCLHSCISISLLNISELKDFLEIFELEFDLISVFLNNFMKSISSSMPALTSVLQILSSAFIKRSEHTEVVFSEELLEKLTTSSDLLFRVFDRLKTSRSFCRLAPYILSDIISKIQMVTLIPNVKERFLVGVYCLIGCCEKNSIVMLQGCLEESSRELFKTLYSNYKKYYEYTGKI